MESGPVKKANTGGTRSKAMSKSGEKVSEEKKRYVI